MAIPRLLRFIIMKAADSPSISGGTIRRVSSPPGMRSTFTTLAPRSTSISPQTGPAITWASSRTLRSRSGPASSAGMAPSSYFCYSTPARHAEGALRTHPECDHRTCEEQADRAPERHVPVAREIDEPAKHDRGGESRDRRARIHDAARRARVLRCDVHRHRPDRADGQLEAEERAAERHRYDREVLEQQHRDEEAERCQKAHDDD